MSDITRINDRMELVYKILEGINAFVWGPSMLILILGVGLFLQISLKFMPVFKIGLSIRLLLNIHKIMGEGQISPYKALMTSMSATVGSGNIAGVAMAIFVGGPGALFWMWITAMVGLATKYAEAVCAVNFREKDSKGNYIGGPMYYIKNGLGREYYWLAPFFAFAGAVAAFGIGNGVQANVIAHIIEDYSNFSDQFIGLGLAAVTGIVIFGGISRIGAVTGRLVPFMLGSYVLVGLVILLRDVGAVAHAFSLIFTHAFTSTAAQGGFAGATVWAAMRLGVSRGVFSNEAGMGSSPMAHAAAASVGPVNQGLIAMLGTFIDTIIVCTITGLVIISTGVWTSGETGVALTVLAFNTILPGIGGGVVSFSLLLFAFSTILGWSYYGERCVCFLGGENILIPYRIFWVFVVYFGAVSDVTLIWLLADTLNAMMAIPNLIALGLLSPLIFKLTREYFMKNGASETSTIPE